MRSKTTHRIILISTLSAMILAIGATAIASTSKISAKKTMFDITSKIYIDGKLISSPRIVTFANKKASMSIENEGHIDSLKYEVIAKNAPNNGMNSPIEMNFDVQYRGGHESIHTKPRMTLLPKQEGIISFKSASGHTYEMRVLTERVV